MGGGYIAGWRASLLAIAGFLLLFIVQGLYFIDSNSQTVDEAAQLAAGYSYLITGVFRLDSEHPPLIKALQALPLFCGTVPLSTQSLNSGLKRMPFED